MILTVVFAETEQHLAAEFAELEHHIDADFGEIVEMINTDIPVYGGPHHAVPSAAEDVILKTSQTFVGSDIRVYKIPYAEVSNNVNGKTVTIA